MRKTNVHKILLVVTALALVLIHGFVSFNLSLSNTVKAGGVIYCSPQGNDSTGNGTISNPYYSPLYALSVSNPGDTILCRGGVYRLPKQDNIVAKAGTNNSWITIKSYPGEWAIIEGGSSYTGMFDTSKFIKFESACKYLRFESLEFRNAARGFSLESGSSNITIKNCTFHDFGMQAIHSKGDNIAIQNCTFYNCAMMNINDQYGLYMQSIGKGHGGWPPTITINGTNTSFVNNILYDSWGEGVIAEHAVNITIAGNRINNCFSAKIYIDGSQNVLVEKNFCYDNADRVSTAFAFGVEDNMSEPPPAIDNVILRNNVAANTKRGIGFHVDFTNAKRPQYVTYKNVRIYNNVFWNTRSGETVKFSSVPSEAPAPFGCILANNIIFAQNNTNGGATLLLGNASGWTVRNNCFPNGIPSGYSGNGNFTSDPKLVNANNNGNIDGFKIQGASPCIAAGFSTSEVTDDYWGSARMIPPCVGIHEYGSSSTPTPSPTATPSPTPSTSPTPTPTPNTTTAVFNASEDSYVRSGIYSSNNYGTEQNLVVKGTSSTDNKRETYIKFDLASSEIPSIQSAVLKIYCNSLPDGGASFVKIFTVNDDSWTETSINWNNKPSTGIALTSSNIPSAGMWYNFDVTSYVNSELNGNKIISICLRDDTNVAKNVIFGSKESSSKPVLEMTYVPPTPTPTPSPSQTIFNAIADSYVRDGDYASTNYGSTSELVVKGTNYSGNIRQAYVKFDLSSTSASNVQSAVLKVYCTQIPDGASFVKVFSVGDDSWLENSINWNNKPSAQNALSFSDINTANAWYQFDITSFVNNQLGTDKIVSLCIMDDSNMAKNAIFGSRETQNSPYIEVTY